MGGLTLNTLVVCNPVPQPPAARFHSVTPRWDNSSSPADTSSPTDTNSYFPIAPDTNVPEGYNVGFSTVSTVIPSPDRCLPRVNRRN